MPYFWHDSRPVGKREAVQDIHAPSSWKQSVHTRRILITETENENDIRLNDILRSSRTAGPSRCPHTNLALGTGAPCMEW